LKLPYLGNISEKINKVFGFKKKITSSINLLVNVIVTTWEKYLKDSRKN